MLRTIPTIVALAALGAASCVVATARAQNLASHAPPIVSRAAWNAKAAQPGMKPHKPVSIMLHHTGEKQQPKISLELKMRGLQNFSQTKTPFGKGFKPAWGDVPYHFYIDMSGRIAEARDPAFMGDTNTKYDTSGHIQVVLEGNFEIETPQRAQLDAVRDLVAWLMLTYNVPPEKISTHKDNAQTVCPGKNFLSGWPALRGEVNGKRRSIVASLCAAQPSADFAKRYCS